MPFEADNILGIIRDYDVILDEQIFSTVLINDTCVMAKKPLVHAGILRLGNALPLNPMNPVPLLVRTTTCRLVPSCRKRNPGCVAGVLGTIQATEAIKLILNIGEPLVGKLLTFEALEMTFRKVSIPRDKQCAICGEKPTITELKDIEQEECEISF